MPDPGSAAERIEYRRHNAVDPEEFLRDLGVIEPSDGDEKLRFASAFVDRIGEQLEAVRADGVGADDIAAMFGVERDDVTTPDRPYPAFKTNYTVRNWPSRGALQLDVATDRELRDATDRWDAVPVRQRYRTLQSLRSFHDECPFCSGPISMSDETVESCCDDVEVVTIGCERCDRRFLEFSADSIAGT